MKKTINAVIFDIEGTLLIKDPSDYKVFHQQCNNVELNISDEIAFKAWHRTELWAINQILKEIKGAPRMHDEDFDKNLYLTALKYILKTNNDNDLKNFYFSIKSLPKINQNFVPEADVYTVLSNLKQKPKAYKLGIVSNFDNSLPNILKEYNIFQYFDNIVYSALVGVEKPNPEILNISCKNLMVNPSQAIYIGDHPLDIVCAKNAGISIIWINHKIDRLMNSIAQPDYEVNNLAEISEIL